VRRWHIQSASPRHPTDGRGGTAAKLDEGSGCVGELVRQGNSISYAGGSRGGDGLRMKVSLKNGER
jgi:hypothetical protein